VFIVSQSRLPTVTAPGNQDFGVIGNSKRALLHEIRRILRFWFWNNGFSQCLMGILRWQIFGVFGVITNKVFFDPTKNMVFLQFFKSG